MSRTFSRSEVKAHGTEDKGLYIIIDSDVYEMSGFINEHPGGQTILRKFGGKDATKAFWRFHNENVLKKYGDRLRVGTLKEAARL